MSVFGFSTSGGGGDFLPICKFDARSGRMFRLDRTQGPNGFATDEVDITQTFKAIFDFENIETGWIDFPIGGAPSFALVPIGQPLPPRPTDKHKNGVRFLVRLSNDCAGPLGAPVREMAGSSKAFVSGIEQAYIAYQADAAKNAGKLPVFVLEKTTPVKSAGGATNYHPSFKLVAWAPRGDLVHRPRVAQAATTANTASAAQPTQASNTSEFGGAAPSTGATQVPPPQAAAAPADANDFG